jgi:hypothetical protein
LNLPEIEFPTNRDKRQFGVRYPSGYKWTIVQTGTMVMSNHSTGLSDWEGAPLVGGQNLSTLPNELFPTVALKPALASILEACKYMGQVSRSKFYADVLPLLETVHFGSRHFVVIASMDRLIAKMLAEDASASNSAPSKLGRAAAPKSRTCAIAAPNPLVQGKEYPEMMSGVDLKSDPRGPRAKAARKWFAQHGPPDLQPLPLGYDEREALKDGSPRHILAYFARSLASLKYDFKTHPSFESYASGVMASPYLGGDSMRNDVALLKRFPPRPLAGLGPGLYWEPLSAED